MTADYQVNIVNIISFNFNSICSIIIAKLKTSGSLNSPIIPNKVDTGYDGISYHTTFSKSSSCGHQGAVTK